MTQSPNILLILNDDMGFSDIGCYGGEIDTPHLDALAEKGIRFTQFYNTARCSPSRASLLTGLHPHQTGIGILNDDDSPEGYSGNLSEQSVTIAEVLRENNYRTYMSGKWHVATDTENVNDTWPKQRGFDRFYGTLNGAGSYYDPKTLTRDNENIEHEAMDDDFYYTDAISNHAVQMIADHFEQHEDKPFFQYVAFTAPHWPLHAPEEEVEKYKGHFKDGWDEIRKERLKRLVDEGIIDPAWDLSKRDPSQPKWEEAQHKIWFERCMEVYAAQIHRMDQGIGRMIKTLEETDQLENTLIIFLSDNGGCAEVIDENWGRGLVKGGSARAKTRSGKQVKFGATPEIMPGSESTYQSYGIGWANVSNTPFRLYKHWVHEGGISTPLIAHWPKGIQAKNELRHTPGQLTDVMATILEVTGTSYPEKYKGNQILPLEGHSLTSVLQEDQLETRPLFWEHEGNAAVRLGKWKLVKKYPGDWELYDMEIDRTELDDLAKKYPDRVKEMAQIYDEWAKRCGVLPREEVLQLMK